MASHRDRADYRYPSGLVVPPSLTTQSLFHVSTPTIISSNFLQNGAHKISSRSVSVSRKKKQSLHHHAALLLPVVALSLWWLLSAPETASRLSKQKSRTSKDHDRDFTKKWPFLPKDDSVQTRSDFLTDKSLWKGAINNTKFLWQLPPMEVKGILFLAHGCHHSMTDWWPKSDETCPECIGLPEEVAIVKIALQELHFVVVAISSLDRAQSRCWSQKDGPIVAKILLDMQAYFGSIPLFAFRASSGGFFCSSILPKATLVYRKAADD
eukprot:scaffold111402_cov45-Attheya_sp.AAC.2